MLCIVLIIVPSRSPRNDANIFKQLISVYTLSQNNLSMDSITTITKTPFVPASDASRAFFCYLDNYQFRRSLKDHNSWSQKDHTFSQT